MGVADNKSYKDQYHFNSKYFAFDRDDLPSINIDPKINSSIKENNDRSNVEIEKNEIVLEPDLTALYHARGKRHSQGGINVSLRPNSFIFSDDPSLSISPEVHDLFGLKNSTRKDNKRLNTPAYVLKRNVDLEHYNKMVSNIEDVKKDDIAKKSSQMMLEKYIQTLGNIAFLQESKKDFPQGLPSFSTGTAPVYDPELKADMEAQKQYAKYGGLIEFQKGGLVQAQKRYNEIIARRNKGLASPAENSEFEQLKKFIFNNPELKYQNDTSRANAQKRYNSAQTPAVTAPAPRIGGDWRTNPHLVGSPSVMDMVKNLGAIRSQAPQAPPPPVVNSDNDARAAINNSISARGRSARLRPISSGVRTNGSGNGSSIYSGIARKETPQTVPQPSAQIPSPPPVSKQADLPKAPVVNPYVPNIDEQPQTGIDINTEFTPWQKISQLYNLGKLASAKRYMPYRSRYNPSYIDASLVNPEQTISDMRAGANNQIDAIGSLSPILRNAQASQMFGQYLNAVPGVRSQYDNQNAQIQNQTRSMNTQIRNQAEQVNMGNDAKYFQEQVTGRANFDNMKNYLGDQYMNNVVQDATDNQSLAYNMLTLDDPAYGFDFRTGNFKRNPKSILDTQSITTGDDTAAEVQRLRSQDPSMSLKDAYIIATNMLKIKTVSKLTRRKGGKVAW